MTTAAVTYCSTKKIDCCVPAEVILCVSSELTVSGKSSIEADLAAMNVISHGTYCSYNYTFTYDNAQLLDPVPGLISTDITGVICRGCLITWIEDFTIQVLTGWDTDELGNFFQIPGFSGSIVFDADPGLIVQDTLDGSDSKKIRLAGGGDGDPERGAYIEVNGNESPNPGDMYLVPGNLSGADINVLLIHADSKFAIRDGNAVLLWHFNNVGDFVYSATGNSSIVSNTSDGVDNQSLFVCGGGAATSDRGGYIQLYGNEAANPGDIYIVSGDISGADVNVLLTNAGSRFAIRDGNAILYWHFNTSGELIYNSGGCLIAANTSDGTDNLVLRLAGGGTSSPSRGGAITLSGNEVGGGITIVGGNIATGDIDLQVSHASGEIHVVNSSGLTIWSLADNGTLTVDGTTGGSIIFANAATNIELTANANGRTGTFSLNGATPVVVPNTSLSASDMITIERDTPAGTPGVWNLTARTNGASFEVTGTALDGSGMRYVLTKIH